MIAMRAKFGGPGLLCAVESHTCLFSSDGILQAERLAGSMTV